jgi:antitoxin (DNA-binding transcriptional repressor) of toxin-antitoxin stability system
VVTRNGKPVALLTPIREDDDLDRLLLAHDPQFVRLLERARERVRTGRYLTSDQFWRQLRRRRTRSETKRSARPAAKEGRR